MKFEINGVEFVVKFEHNIEERSTTASLYGKDIDGTTLKNPFHSETVVCHPNDKFTKIGGKKHVLAKLLDYAEKYLFRKLVWEVFFEEFPKSK